MNGDRKWKDAEADLAERKANAIEAALYGLEGIEGMFSDRPELRASCHSTRALLQVEEDNLRKKAARLATVAA